MTHQISRRLLILAALAAGSCAVPFDKPVQGQVTVPPFGAIKHCLANPEGWLCEK